jgi:hypothetical protein
MELIVSKAVGDDEADRKTIWSSRTLAKTCIFSLLPSARPG